MLSQNCGATTMPVWADGLSDRVDEERDEEKARWMIKKVVFITP